jgi:hypothetical protein
MVLNPKLITQDKPSIAVTDLVISGERILNKLLTECT